MGYVVVGSWEYGSSKYCPHCEGVVEYHQGRIRALQCTKCRRIYHRDEMAGQNFVIIAYNEISLRRVRPARFIDVANWPNHWHEDDYEDDDSDDEDDEDDEINML